jgi:replicative DNA helicase
MSIESMVFLGQCMNSHSVLFDTVVKPDDFTESFHRSVFESILRLHEKGHVPQFDVVAHDMGESMTRIMEISNAGSVTANWRWYEQAVIEQARRHKVKLVAETVMTTPNFDLGEVLSQIEGVSDIRSRYPVVNNAEAVEQAISTVLKRKELAGELIGVTTGIKSLDRVLYGFQKRRLYYVGARPSMGKTMLLLNFLAECKVPAGFISLESSQKELTMRLLARQSLIDSEHIVLGHLGDNGMDRVYDAGIQIRDDMSFHIYDESNMHIRTLVAKATKMRRDFGIEILFIDYLQAISYPEAGKKYEQVQEISKTLKDLARDLNIPVVCSAQLRRDSEGVRPKLSDFSDSTQVERDADVAIMINKGEDMDDSFRAKRMYLLVEKNRDGKVADVLVYFDPSVMKVTC